MQSEANHRYKSEMFSSMTPQGMAIALVILTSLSAGVPVQPTQGSSLAGGKR